MNFLNNLPTVVRNLLIINILFFLATIILENKDIFLISEFGIYYFGSENFKFYQIFTCMFMHGGIGHIFMNMFALVSFGVHLERNWGSKKFLQFYLFCGIGATLFTFLFDALLCYYYTGQFLFYTEADLYYAYEQNSDIIRNIVSPSVGASGALFGVMAAFYKFYPDVPVQIMFIPIDIKIRHLFPFFVILSAYLLLFPINGDFIDHGAHLGGAIAGFIFVTFIQKSMYNYD